MVRRGQPPGENLWTIPGGRLEHGEYLSTALRREVKEETGLEVDPGALLGIFEVVGDPHFVILDYLATVTDGAAPLAAGDVREAAWVPLDEVHKRECTPRFVQTLTGWGVLEPRD